jgi:hypothetical protein
MSNEAMYHIIRMEGMGHVSRYKETLLDCLWKQLKRNQRKETIMII